MMSAASASAPPDGRSPRWGLLPVTVAAALGLSYPRLSLLAKPGESALALLAGAILCVLIIAGLLAHFRIPLAAEGEPGRRRRLTWFALAAIALFCVFAGHQIEFFPSILDGESAAATNNAYLLVNETRMGRSRLWLIHQALSYNTGLTPLMIPVVWWFGPDALACRWTNVAVWAVLLVGGLTLLARQIQPRGRTPLLPWALGYAICVGGLLPSVRLYKWHVVSLAAALGIAIVAVALEGRMRRLAFAAGLVLTGAAMLLYHGNLIFVPGLVFLVLLHLVWPERGTRFPLRALVVLGFCALVAVSYFVFVHGPGSGLEHRAETESRHLQVLSTKATRDVFIHHALRALAEFITGPTIALGALGLGSAIARARGDAMMRALLILFASGVGTSAMVQSLWNPSHICWFLLPMLLFIALGIIEFCERLVAAIPWAAVAHPVAAIALLAAAIPEWNSYQTLFLWRRLDSPPLAWNTSEQFALINRRISEEPNEVAAQTLQVLPGPTVPVESGGFFRQTPFAFHEVHPRAAEFRFFASSGELAQILDAFQAGRLRQTRLELWLSFRPERAALTPEMFEPALAGRTFAAQLFTLQEAPLPVAMRSWKVVFERPPSP